MQYNISINVTDLANLPDNAVTKASNGKFYLNCTLFINDTENENGAIGSVVYSKKIEGKNEFQKTYIANVRHIKKNEEDKDTKSWKEHLAR